MNVVIQNAADPDPGAPPGHERVATLEILPAKNKAEGDARLAEWLKDEILSAYEARKVVETFQRDKDPRTMEIRDLDEYMQLRLGKSFGKWTVKDRTDKVNLSTADMIDFNSMEADFKDHLAIHRWYMEFRQRRLKNLISYAEKEDFTIEQLERMSTDLEKKTVDTVPQPTHLMATAKTLQTEAEARPDQITNLLTKTLAAKEALFAAMNDLGEMVHGFKEKTDAYSKDLHAFRSSVILDLGAAKKEMADVRKFFLEKEHLDEMARLKEFIELCEQFKRLKDSGVLDVITDAILKLEGVGK